MNQDDLADIEAIKQLKARYFRCLDKKLWHEFGETTGYPWWGRAYVVGVEPFEQPQAQFHLAQQRRLDGCVLGGPDPAKVPGEGLVPAAAVTHMLLHFRIGLSRGAPRCHRAACLLPGL